MHYSIFYSWQSDSPAETNRTFIRNAINEAIASMHTNTTVEDSPRVESGMEGVAGTPEVASVMFKRIRESAIFIGDTTLVGTIPNKPPKAGEEQQLPKKVPNPNVSIEMGYAAGIAGWSRIICVMNEYFGTRAELPFDVRNRRFPINYTLDPDKPETSSQVRRDLAKWLRVAIETVEKQDYERVEEAVKSLDVHCLDLMNMYGRSQWFAAPNTRGTFIGGQLDTAKFSGAVIRLLDLRLLKADVAPDRGEYAYHWTYLGVKVLEKMKHR